MQAELEAWWHKMVREGLSDEVFSQHSDVSSEHGRIETRACQQLVIDKTWLDKKYQWEGLKSIIKVTPDVIEKSTGKETSETRWYKFIRLKRQAGFRFGTKSLASRKYALGT